MILVLKSFLTFLFSVKLKLRVKIIAQVSDQTGSQEIVDLTNSDDTNVKAEKKLRKKTVAPTFDPDYKPNATKSKTRRSRKSQVKDRGVKSRRTANRWIRFLDSYRLEHKAKFRLRPNDMVKAAGEQYKLLSEHEKNTF